MPFRFNLVFQAFLLFVLPGRIVPRVDDPKGVGQGVLVRTIGKAKRFKSWILKQIVADLCQGLPKFIGRVNQAILFFVHNVFLHVPSS